MLSASEKNLHHQVKVLAASERKILSDLLEHLQQVYNTRLFAKMGHSSIIKYLVRELGYSESAAYRRHQALKLTKEIPKTKEMVKTGELNLSNINQLQTIMHGKTTEDKEKAIGQIKGKTSKDTSDILFELNPEKKKDIPASKTRISTGMTRLSVTMSDTAMKKLNTLQARTKCYDNNKLIELALDLALSSTDLTKNTSVRPNPEYF